MIIYNRIIKLLKKKFVRDVAVVAIGTTGAQVITVAFAPIITRLYGPEAFGALGTFLAILGIVTPIAALTYPIAIVLPHNDIDAIKIVKLSIYISIGLSIFISPFLYFFGDSLVVILKAQEIQSFILLIPPVIIISSWLQAVQQWKIRKKQFKLTAKVAIIQSLILNGSKSIMGFFNPTAAVLIILSVIGNALYAFLLSFGIINTSNVIFSERTNIKSLFIIAKQYYDFPIFRAPQVFINAISQSLPVLMLASFFGPASAGFYTLVKKLLEMPSQLIGKSVSDVFYPKVNESIQKEEKILKLLIKSTLSLALIGFIPFGIILAFGPYLFGLIFGHEWVTAGEYARWMTFMMFFFFINKPCVAAIPVLGLQKGLLIYEIFSTFFKIIALYIGFVYFNNDKIAVILFSIFGALSYAFLILWVFLSCFSSDKKLNKLK